MPRLSQEQISVIDSVLSKIKNHPKYSKAINGAVSDGLDLSLNYHTHPNETTYCVSILSEKIDLLTLAENQKSFVELAHIRNIGKSEEDCIPLMTYFGKRIKDIYILSKLPDIYLNGYLHLQDN